MKRLDFRTVVVVLLAAAAGCKGDPTADLRTGVSSINLNPDLMFISQDSSKALKVVIRDQQLNPVVASVTVTTSDAAVFTVKPDTTVPTADSTNYNFIITAGAPGQASVIATAAGLTDSATVTVLPTAFTGALSSTTPKGGDTLTIASTALLKFDPAHVTVSFGTDTGIVVGATTDQIKVLVPFGGPRPATIGGIVVTYVPGLEVVLPTADVITQTGDFWAPGDTGYASAPALPQPTTSGQSTYMIVAVPSVLNDANCAEGTGSGGTGKCIIFRYTANGTDSLQFTVNWTPATDANDNSDIDIYSCNSTGVAGCFEGGAAGAAGASAKTPEVFAFKPSAGVHYLVIEQYSTGQDQNPSVTITKLK